MVLQVNQAQQALQDLMVQMVPLEKVVNRQNQVQLVLQVPMVQTV